MAREVELFRTTSEWVHTEAERGGRPISDAERSALKMLRSELETVNTAADTVAARELIYTLLHLGIKLEQERY